MTSFKSITGKRTSLDKLIPLDLSSLNPAAHEGAIVRTLDDILKISNGTEWITIGGDIDVEGRLSALETVTVSGLNVGGSTSVSYELGSTVTPTFNWKVDGPIYPSVLTLNGTPLAVTATSGFLTLSATTDVTVSATVPNGKVSTNTMRVTFLNRVFFGTSTNASLTASQVIGLGGSALASGGATERSIAASGGYIYYAIPASWPTPNAFSLNGYATTFTETIQSVTTAVGLTINYKVFRSTQRQSNPVLLKVT